MRCQYGECPDQATAIIESTAKVLGESTESPTLHVCVDHVLVAMAERKEMLRQLQETAFANSRSFRKKSKYTVTLTIPAREVQQ